MLIFGTGESRSMTLSTNILMYLIRPGSFRPLQGEGSHIQPHYLDLDEGEHLIHQIIFVNAIAAIIENVLGATLGRRMFGLA